MPETMLPPIHRSVLPSIVNYEREDGHEVYAIPETYAFLYVQDQDKWVVTVKVTKWADDLRS